MLQKSRISDAIMQSDEWRQERLAKFTSSRIWELMGEKALGDTGMNYIRTRAFEALAGVSSEQEFQSQATADGLVNEPYGLRKAQERLGIEFLVTQKLVNDVNPRFASTPDGLAIMSASMNELEYEAHTIEIKCFQAAAHMESVECNSASEIKIVNKKIYYQVLDQLLVVDALKGYLVFFHPDLPENRKGLHIIEFRRVLLREDINKLKERKKEALELFNKMIN